MLGHFVENSQHPNFPNVDRISREKGHKNLDI